MDDSRPLYWRVAEDIVAKIDDRSFLPGDKLPSERALCEQYSVSQITIRRALRELAHINRVYSHHGLGWFVSDPPQVEAPRHRVIFVVPQMDEISADLLRSVANRLNPEGILLVPAFTDGDERAETRLLQSFVKEETAAVLLTVCGKEQNAKERYKRILATLTCPGILLMHDVKELDVPFVTLNEQKAMGELTRHVIQQGHRRIAYAGSDPSMVAGQQRYSGFATTLWEHGLELPLDWVFSEDLANGADGERFRRVLGARYAPTALVCASNLRAAQALATMSEVGVPCPEGMAVVALEDREYAPYLPPPLTTFRFDRDRLGEAVADMIFAAINGAPTRRVSVGGQIIVRKSCGTLAARVHNPTFR